MIKFHKHVVHLSNISLRQNSEWIIDVFCCISCTDMVGGGVIQWHLDYNAWDVLLGQVHVLLNQVSYLIEQHVNLTK